MTEPNCTLAPIVISGRGVVASIGSDIDSFSESLKGARGGIESHGGRAALRSVRSAAGVPRLHAQSPFTNQECYLMTLVRLKDITKNYTMGATTVAALAGIDLRIEERDFVAVWGPSGSGKSSLLNLIGLIDTPSAGTVYLNGQRVDALSDDELAEIRNRNIGIVFQGFNLVPVLNALENVMMPLQINGTPVAQAREAAARRLAEVGLAEHMLKRPDQMSGGQKQRVAIARALVGSPSLVIADEPTANLDSDTSTKIIELMRSLNRKEGVTFIFSTHDPRLLSCVDKLIRMQDGRIVTEKAGELHAVL
jgi:putative ABC transport system ATP-binding protein